jgi:hypothetical protein
MASPSTSARLGVEGFIEDLRTLGVVDLEDLQQFRNKLTAKSLISDAKALTTVKGSHFRQELEKRLKNPDLGPDRDEWLRRLADQAIARTERETDERNTTARETEWVKELVEAADSIGAKIVLLRSDSEADAHLVAGLRKHNLVVAKELGPGRSEYRILAAPQNLSVEGGGQIVIPHVLLARVPTAGPPHCEPNERSIDLRFTQAAIRPSFSGPDEGSHPHLRKMDVTLSTEARLRLKEEAIALGSHSKEHTRASFLVAATFSALCLGFGVIAGLVLGHESLLYLGLVGAVIGLPAVFLVVHRDLHADANIRNLPPLNVPPKRLQYDLEADKYVFEQERARVTAYVGGIATAAAGFIATLVVALLKGEVSRTINPWWPAKALAGAVVLIGYAIFLSLTLRPLNRRFSKRHPQ